jgi:hypothetical protein
LYGVFRTSFRFEVGSLALLCVRANVLQHFELNRGELRLRVVLAKEVFAELDLKFIG